MTQTLDDVLDWMDVLWRCIDDYGEPYIHPATLLALIHVESAGDDRAHRDGSRYWGLLQIADPYLADARQVVDDLPERAEDLHGDGIASIATVLAYWVRYHDYHHWHPTLMAVAHKGGVGTAKAVAEELREGAAMPDAVRYAQEKHGVPAVREYLRRFEQARAVYAGALE